MNQTINTQQNQPEKLNRLVMVLLLFLVGMLIYAVISRKNESQNSEPLRASDAQPAQHYVEIALKLPEEDEKRVQVTWNPGMTVFEATQSAGEQDPYFLSQWQGSGAMAFLTELGGISNQGSVGQNWLFSVNGQEAKLGAGATKIVHGDHVLWEFRDYQ